MEETGGEVGRGDWRADEGREGRGQGIRVVRRWEGVRVGGGKTWP